MSEFDFNPLHHALEATCRLGVIKAEASGKGTAQANAASDTAP